MKKEKKVKNSHSLISKLRAYKLEPQIVVVCIVAVIFIVSFWLYHLEEFQKNEVALNLLLAIFTSLLVTVFTMVADIVVAYQQHENETFFEDMHEFGIESLSGDKETVLRERLQECKKTIWVTGYRLILTERLKKDIYEAVLRGADFYAVICPPWTEAFQMVYGEHERVMDYYVKVFGEVLKAKKKCGRTDGIFEVHFVNKPIFSDTYRADQYLITGPYMHNKDEEFHKMMAKDFFSYSVVRESRLSQIIKDEYRLLFHQEYESALDWTKFEEVYEDISTNDYTDSKKMKRFQSAVVPVENRV